MWPFGRRGNFTEQITEAWQALIEKAPDIDVTLSSAAEVAAGLISRALSRATVQPEHAAITSEWLSRVGEDLIFRGAHLSEIKVMNGGTVSLEPAASWSSADSDGSRVIVNRIDGTTGNVSKDGVLYMAWHQNPVLPFEAVGPLHNYAGRVAAGTGRSIGDELKLPTMGAVPTPHSSKEERAELVDKMREGRGRLQVVKSTASGWQHDGPGAAPRKDWVQERLGPMPPVEMVELLTTSYYQALASCGIPPEMVSPTGAGQSREVYRRWMLTLIEPLGDRLAAIASRALNTQVTLTFPKLRAHDMAGAARAVHSLVQSGWSPQEAAAAVGLDPPAARAQQDHEDA